MMTKDIRFQYVLLFLFSIGIPLHAQTDSSTLRQVLDRAYIIANTGNVSSAISITDSLMKGNQNFASGWWALSQFQIGARKFPSAIESLTKYRMLRPLDWEALPFLIQSYQFVGDTSNRDMKRTELFRLYEEGKDSTLLSQTEYLLENFRTDTSLVEVYEQFNPKRPRQEFIYFYWFDATGHQIGKFSLGSYDSDNNFAKQRDSFAVHERIYTLDYNDKHSHATFGFFSGKPSYNTLRATVIDAILGKKGALSKSVFR